MRVLITDKIKLNSEIEKGNEGKKKGGRRGGKGKWREEKERKEKWKEYRKQIYIEYGNTNLATLEANMSLIMQCIC